jgi:hypothetical protein
MVTHAVKVLHEGTEQDVMDVMSGERRVRTISDEITQANDFTLSPQFDPKVEQVKELKGNILAAAKGLRREMDEMFRLTKWSGSYKRLHRDLRTIIFDE